MQILEEQEQIFLAKSAKMNLDPGKVTTVTGMTDDHLQEADPSK